jgi:hypothetical protein
MKIKHSGLFLIGLLMLASSCKEDERPLVVSKIQAAAKLCTTEVTIEKFVFATKEKRLLFLIKLNEAYFAAHTEARVKLGIDLSKIRKEDIDIKDLSISLMLPPVEVLNFSYPFENFKEDFTIRDDATLNRISVADIEEFYRQGEMDIRSNLQFMGLVDKTKTNTRVLLRGMLAGLGYEEIYIDFKPQDDLPGAVTESEQKLDGI